MASGPDGGNPQDAANDGDGGDAQDAEDGLDGRASSHSSMPGLDDVPCTCLQCQLADERARLIAEANRLFAIDHGLTSPIWFAPPATSWVWHTYRPEDAEPDQNAEVVDDNGDDHGDDDDDDDAFQSDASTYDGLDLASLSSLDESSDDDTCMLGGCQWCK